MSDREITLEQLHRDLIAHAGSISNIVENQRNMQLVIDEMKLDRAVRVERDRNLNDRLDRIEKSIDSVYTLGKWLLAAIGAAFLTAFVTFVVNGGLNVAP